MPKYHLLYYRTIEYLLNGQIKIYVERKKTYVNRKRTSLIYSTLKGLIRFLYNTSARLSFVKIVMAFTHLITIVGLILSGYLPLSSLLTYGSENTCGNIERSADCLFKFDPVCALVQGGDCKSGICYQTKINSCAACSEPSVLSYTSEPCQPVKESFCPDNSVKKVEECPEIMKPVCAFYAGDKCDEGICTRTIRNACHACINSAVLFYLDDECPSSLNICQLEDRYDNSSKQGWLERNTAVVAFYKGEKCNSNICSRTEISGKRACQDPDVLFYIPDPLEIGLKFK